MAKIIIQIGDIVKKGQLPMQLDTTDLPLALKAAQTSLASAQTNFESTPADSQFALRTARAILANAQTNYDSAEVKYATAPNQRTVAKA